MKIDSADREVKEILTSGFYQVPRFQRPYSWDLENVGEFWTDTIQDSDIDYFIGPMVVYKSSPSVFGIVDGQQRLTTITMMLCALRDTLAEEKFFDLAEGINTLILKRDIDNKPKFILATETSFPYLQEYILKYGEPAIAVEPRVEELNLARAYARLQDFIRSAVQSVKDDTTIKVDDKPAKIKQKLKDIRDKLLSLKLIFIILENEDDAYIIFETLNTRGMNLTVSDLVKNLFTRLLKPDSSDVDTTKLKWNTILEIIQSSSAEINTNTYLHHYWLSKYDYVTMKKLFKQMKVKIKKGNALAFLDAFVNDAAIYRGIHETGFRKWAKPEKKIRHSLEAYTLFRVQQLIPMVLAVMREYAASNISRKDVEGILSSLENFHFIFTAITSQRSSGGISQMYAAAARRLSEASSNSKKREVLSELKNKLRDKKPNFDEFEANWKEVHYSRQFSKQKKLVKYILSRFDSYYNQAATIDYSAMTIEHLLSESKSRTDQQEKVVAQLGNLILVTEKVNNEKLAAKSFKEKKQILIDSKVSVDPTIENADDWKAKQIKQRTNSMAKIAYDTLWKI